ncbi:hypothetical protein EXS93_00015 [Helicobacter pylori]|nr:hypothetical protein [Helicobacter pylori]NHB38087.1 hypothetical protein [Helicobacter pylori]NHB45996.1 hypothetical protein [Helicobacter pylori]
MTTNAPLKTELKFSLTDSKPEKKRLKLCLEKTNAKESFKKVGSKNYNKTKIKTIKRIKNHFSSQSNPLKKFYPNFKRSG